MDDEIKTVFQFCAAVIVAGIIITICVLGGEYVYYKHVAPLVPSPSRCVEAR